MQSLHFDELVGRKHIGIGEEELQFGGRFNETVLLELVEELEGGEEVVLLQEEVDTGLAAHFLGNGAMLAGGSVERRRRDGEGGARRCHGHGLPP